MLRKILLKKCALEFTFLSFLGYTYLFEELARSDSSTVDLRHTSHHLENNETRKCRREGETARVYFISLLDSSILRIFPRIYLVSRSLLPHPLVSFLDTSRYSFRIPKPPCGSISLTSRQPPPSCNIFCMSFDAFDQRTQNPSCFSRKKISRRTRRLRETTVILYNEQSIIWTWIDNSTNNLLFGYLCSLKILLIQQNL